jgi:hypothetical protein
MTYRAWNFGPTREIPYKGQPVFLQKDSFIDTQDEGLVAELKKFPYIEIEEIAPRLRPQGRSKGKRRGRK